jgi:hypothetical protein
MRYDNLFDKRVTDPGRHITVGGFASVTRHVGRCPSHLAALMTLAWRAAYLEYYLERWRSSLRVSLLAGR